MNDTDISAGCAVAYGAWVISLILWGVGWSIDSRGLLTLSLIICAVAVTATVRTYLVGLDRRIKTAMTVTSTVTTLSRR